MSNGSIQIHETIVELDLTNSPQNECGDGVSGQRTIRRFREHEREISMAYVTSLYIRYPDGWCTSLREAKARLGRTDFTEVITFRPNPRGA